MSQKTFECRLFGPIRFKNVHPLNICLTSKKSDRKMVRGLGRMAGGVVVPSKTQQFFSVTIFKNLLSRCHAKNMFNHLISLVKRLPTQVFLAQLGN